MASDPIPTWFFAVVVVRRADRFLLVRERKHGQTWYLPAGRVEPGETLSAAACRETMQEAGIAITLTGVLRIGLPSTKTNPGGCVLSDSRARATAGARVRRGAATCGTESAMRCGVAPFAGPLGRSAAQIPPPRSTIPATTE